jgi:mannose-6-phosphate isomerase-like protein (cupin superfamily)
MAAHAFGGPIARLGFAGLALAWLVTGTCAYRAIRAGNVALHRRWMVRNFALTFAAVTLRLWLPASMVRASRSRSPTRRGLALLGSEPGAGRMAVQPEGEPAAAARAETRRGRPVGPLPPRRRSTPMSRFATLRLPADRTVVAPDGSDVRVLLGNASGGMAHFELAAGRTARAVTHRTVEEIWFVVAGRGEMWRKLGDVEETVALEPGICLTIPLGTHFQFRAAADQRSRPWR